MNVALKAAVAATSVTFSVAGKFIIPNQSQGQLRSPTTSDPSSEFSFDNLVVVCDNVLTLYTVNHADRNDSGSIDQLDASETLRLVSNGSLRYVASVTLAASPTSVNKVTIRKGRPDQLVLVFDHEHLSIVSFDDDKRAFVTNALYHLGDHAIAKDDVGVPSLLSVDSLNRCIAMLIRRRYLAIIPIYKLTADSQKASTNAATTSTTKKGAVDDWGDEGDYTDTVKTEDAGSAATTAAAAAKVAEPVHRFLGEPKYLDLLALPNRIKNVRDMAFTPSTAGDPTIGFLCEREPTWAGRVKLIDIAAGRRTANLATCSVSWLVIQAATIGDGTSATEGPLQTHQAVTQLVPFNASRLVPCALPGCDPGFFVLTANCILHVTRTKATGFYLNDYGREESACSTSTTINWSALERPVRKTERIAEHNLTFADACAMLIGPTRAVLACPVSGLLCVLDVTVSGRDVTALSCFPVTHAAIASSISLLNAGYTGGPLSSLFLGSAVGDSLVLSIPASGQPKATPWLQTILRNYGPIVAADIGDFSTKDENENNVEVGADAEGDDTDNPYKEILAQAVAPDVPTPFGPLQQTLAASDLVFVGGEGQSGHVTIARQSIRPITFVTQQTDCVSLFVADLGVAGGKGNLKRSREELPEDDDDEELSPLQQDGGNNSGSKHKSSQLLFLSFAASTLLYELSTTVVPVDAATVPFDTNSRTVWAKNVQCRTASSAIHSRLVQVTDRSVLIVQGESRQLIAAIELISSTNDGASSTTEDDAAAATTAPTPRTTLSDVVLKHAFAVTGTSLICATSTSGIVYVIDVLNPSVVVLNEKLSMLLNGQDVKITAACDAPIDELLSDEDGIICVVDQKGTLHIVGVSTGQEDGGADSDETGFGVKVVKSIASFSTLPTTVLRSEILEGQIDAKKGRASNKAPPEITELLFTTASSSLFVLSACGELAVYTIRAGDFFKVDQKFVDREYAEKLESLEEKKKRLNLADGEVTVQDVTARVKSLTQRLIPFDDLHEVLPALANSSTLRRRSDKQSALPGVFVCGRRTSLFFSKEGRLVHHPFQTHGSIRGFCEIATEATRASFVVAGEGFISFCALDRKTDYLADWCVRREIVKKTPHFVGYMAATRSCFVVVSEPSPFRPVRAPFDVELKITIDEESGNPMATGVVPRAEQPYIPITSPVPVPMNDRYTVTLYSAVPWKLMDSLPLDENEQVLAGGVGTLTPETDGAFALNANGLPQTMTMFALGTAFPLGEDTTCRGRLILLKASSDSSKKKSIITVHKEDSKGPVTAISFVKTYVAAAVGGSVKIYAYDAKQTRLVTISFLSAANYIPKLVGFKDFVVFGDLFSSITLSKIHIGDKSTYTLAKHAKDFEVNSVEVLYRGKDLGFVVGDPHGNTLLLSFQGQRDRDGNVVGGKLVEDAGSRVSSAVTSTLRMRVPKANKAELSDEALVVYGTAGGEIGFFQPVSERAARTIASLTKAMGLIAAQPAGLDPTSFRAIPTLDPARGIYTNEVMLDGDAAQRFMLLSYPERALVASAAKVSQEGILSALCGISEQSLQIL